MVTEKPCQRPGCSNTFLANGARKFCDQHATGKPKPAASEPANGLTAFIVPIYVNEAQLDDFWSKLPIEEKALAVQLYWDNSNLSEETKTSAPTPEKAIHPPAVDPQSDGERYAQSAYERERALERVSRA